MSLREGVARTAIAVACFLGWLFVFSAAGVPQPWLPLLAVVCAVFLSAIDLIWIIAIDAIFGDGDLW